MIVCLAIIAVFSGPERAGRIALGVAVICAAFTVVLAVIALVLRVLRGK
jgi:hypothetical protein